MVLHPFHRAGKARQDGLSCFSSFSCFFRSFLQKFERSRAKMAFLKASRAFQVELGISYFL
jgi:hypothetical protein